MVSFETLPERALARILNNLSRADAANCRLVNRYLKEKTVTLYENWFLRVERKTPAAFLASMLQSKVTGLKLSDWGKKVPFRPILQYPDLLTSFECEKLALCEVRPEELHVLLNSATNLVSLKLCLTPQDLGVPILSESPYNFPHLRTLEIRVDKLYTNIRMLCCAVKTTNLFSQLLLHSKMPKVDSISVTLEHIASESVKLLSEALFSFLERNGPGLKKLRFTCQNPPYSLKSGTGYLRTCTKLDEIRLQSEDFLLDSKVWTQLIQSQTKLTSLEIDAPQYFREFLEEMQPKISSTLTSLCLKKLSLRNVDMSMFQGFPALRKLTLDASDELVDPKMYNLAYLPQWVKELEVSEFSIGKEDLAGFCSNRERLTRLTIGNTEDIRPGGLKGSMLRRIMKIPGIIRIEFTDGEICMKGSRLVQISRSMGHENVSVFERNGFVLGRESLDSSWQFINNSQIDNQDSPEESDSSSDESEPESL